VGSLRVWQFVQWAEQHGENDGAGRGAAGGRRSLSGELEEGGQEVRWTRHVGRTRKNFTALDFAALKDIGWESDGGGSTETGARGEVPAPETTRSTSFGCRAHDRHSRRQCPTNTDRASSSTASRRRRQSDDELIINGGSKNDRITLQSLDPAFAAKITINAELGI